MIFLNGCVYWKETSPCLAVLQQVAEKSHAGALQFSV